MTRSPTPRSSSAAPAWHLLTAPGGLLTEIPVGEPLTCIGPRQRVPAYRLPAGPAGRSGRPRRPLRPRRADRPGLPARRPARLPPGRGSATVAAVGRASAGPGSRSCLARPLPTWTRRRRRSVSPRGRRPAQVPDQPPPATADRADGHLHLAAAGIPGRARGRLRYRRPAVRTAQRAAPRRPHVGTRGREVLTRHPRKRPAARSRRRKSAAAAARHGNAKAGRRSGPAPSPRRLQ